jgi:protein TonB
MVMKAQDQRRWSDRPGGPRRFALLAAVALAHFGILALLIAMPQDQLLRVRDEALKLVTIPLPPPAPSRPDPPKPPPRKATQPPPKRSPPPAVKPPPPLPVPVPAVEAAANVDLGASVGSGPPGLGSGTGSGGGGGGGGGIAQHAEWVGGGLTNRDYPDAAKRARLQGVVDVRFIVQVDGRVRECKIDHSSGSAELDRMTCGIIEQRLLYNPALDPAGKPVEEMAGRRFRFVMVARQR